MVDDRLSQMILDKVFHGILDQGAACLVVFEKPEEDASCRSLVRSSVADAIGLQKTYDATLQTIGHVSQLVELLFDSAQKL